jgi:GDP-D-mannose 3',5'-epimerase
MNRIYQGRVNGVEIHGGKGVDGRNSDNTFIKKMLGWEPSTAFREGLGKTYRWIEEQYLGRKDGKQTVSDLQ